MLISGDSGGFGIFIVTTPWHDQPVVVVSAAAGTKTSSA
jgi:hypothetical protein